MNKFILYFYVIIATLASILPSFSAHADKPYVDTNRVAYVASVFRAFRETKNQNIYNTYRYIRVADKNNCRSSLLDLRVECLLSFANKNCAEIGGVELKGRCKLFSDIIVVNKLSEKSFIKKSERYRILTSAGQDYREAIDSRLQQKYARLVTQFSLEEGAGCQSEDFDCMAKALDQFCLDYTNSQNLSWQYCVSASLWFIGTSK